MIGLGKWLAHVDTMFYKGDAIFEIEDDNGKYEIELSLPGGDVDLPDINIHDITEDGNNIKAKADVSLLPGKSVDIDLTFEGDTCNGFLKVPFIGKIKIKDAKKI